MRNAIVRLLLPLAMLVVPPAALADSTATARHAPANIQYTVGSSTLPLVGTQRVGEAAGWLQENPDGLIVVDSFMGKGSEESLQLALRRGDKIREKLMSLGVDANQVLVAVYARGRSEHPVVTINKSRVTTDKLVEARRSAKTVLVGTTVRSGRNIVANR